MSSQVGNALPNEWLFQAYFNMQLMGTDGTGCTHAGPGVSTWYGDSTPRSADNAQLGLFFPTNVTLVRNPAGPGVGGDPTNVNQMNSACGGAGCNVTSWTVIPSGALAWGSAPYPAPFVTLPATAWPACTGGVMSFAGSAFTAPPEDASGAARAGGVAALGLAALAAAALL